MSHHFQERLLEYLLIVGPAPASPERVEQPPVLTRSFSKSSPVVALNTWDIIPQQAPKVLRKFPAKNRSDFPLPLDVSYFCLPDGCYVSVSEPECHVFMLTDTQSNIQTYGVCARISEHFDCLTSSAVEADCQEKRTFSICLLSRHPFFHFFKRCLATFLHFILDFCGDEPIWKALTSESGHAEQRVTLWPELRHWIDQLLALKAPIPGESALEVELEVNPALIVCYPPPNRLPLLDLPVSEMFQRLTVCTVIDIFKLVISEQKVILYSSDPAFASECVLSIVALLYPLQYLFPVIPLLPTCMPTTENLLMVPTPFFIGVSASFLKKLSPIHRFEVWLVNLDTKEIQRPESYEEESILQFPYSILQLQADLRKVMDQQGEDSPSPRARGSGSSSACSKFSVDEVNAKWEVDVGIRVAFVQFLLCSEVLGNIDQHLSLYRLFPRPVVALKTSTFMGSYLKSSSVADVEFIRDLIQSQSIEYFLEWSLNPTNCAFEEIRRGTTSCEKIGDKYMWFIHKMGLHLDQVCLYPNDENSQLFLKMLTHKASQAQYCMVQYCDVPSYDHSPDNGWEVLDHKGLNCNDPNSSEHSGGASMLSSAEIEVTGYMSENNSAESPPISGGCSLTESALQLHLKSSMEEDVTQAAGGGGAVHKRVRSWSGNSVGHSKFGAATGVCGGDPQDCQRSATPDFPMMSELGVRDSGRERFSTPLPPGSPTIRYSLPLIGPLTEHFGSRGSRGYPPSVSPREMPVLTPLNRPPDDHMIQDLVNRVMDGQGIPWPKPLGMKTLAAEEKSRVAVLRMLEVRLGVRTPSDTVMATEEQIQHVGVSKSVCKGLQELLKYFIQCIEQDFQRDPDGVIFSAFLVFRLAFSIFLKTSPVQRGSPTQKSSSGSSPDKVVRERSPFGTPVDKTTPLLNAQRPSQIADMLALPLGGSTSLGSSPVPEDGVTPLGPRRREVKGAGVPSAVEGSRLSQARLSQSSLTANMEGVTPTPSTPAISNSTPTPSTPAISTSTPTPSTPAISTSTPTPSTPAISTSTSTPAISTSTPTPGISTSTPGISTSTSAISTSTPTSGVHAIGARPFSLVAGPLLSFYSPSTPGQEEFQSPASLPGSMPPLHRKLTFLYQRMQSQASLADSPRILGSSDTESLKQEGSFLYKGLVKVLGTSQALLLNRQFWNVLFMSTVHTDRTLMGWNEQTSELYTRYNSLADGHRQAFGFEEDDMLSLILHNLLVYMLMVGMGTEETLDIVQRLAAKTRLATIEEKLLHQTLKHVEEKHSSDLDLTDLGLLPLYSESHPSVTYVVHYGRTMEAPVFYLQVTDEACILKQFPDDKISCRFWNDLITDISCDSKNHVLTIFYKDYKHHFHTKQYLQMYRSLQLLVYNRSIDIQ